MGGGRKERLVGFFSTLLSQPIGRCVLACMVKGLKNVRVGGHNDSLMTLMNNFSKEGLLYAETWAALGMSA